MDAVDFWGTRTHSVKRLPTRHNSDGDEYTRAFFPCPFCYVEIEVQVLCSHLQNEHCFNMKNAVCPLCAASLGKDATGHFIVQHTSSLKHRRRSYKYGLLTENSGTLGKEMRSFLGFGLDRMKNNDTETDQFLSPFLGGVSHSYLTGGSDQDEISKDSVSTSNSKSSISSVAGDNEPDPAERRQRAAFILELIESTIF